eukprot:TRINITY_DN38010_c0_g1_i15.p2 TRINITY_DN38010_c0_g1~~TRINITY_DN38010_c0_g1_i15.p2  ORF type:complete len:168 (+),score=30.61 TRINITY_DN38010_c0_g1_i15:1033-1536(+)
MQDILSSHDAGFQTDIAILDFSKAFDTPQTAAQDGPLWRERNYHSWQTNFLTKRKTRVVLGGEASYAVAVESGVPQGTVLGPLLFLCHINDLPDTVKSTVRLFADDCLLYTEIRTFRITCPFKLISTTWRNGQLCGDCGLMHKSATSCPQDPDPPTSTVLMARSSNT